MKHPNKDDRPGYELIFVKYFTKNGKRFYASAYGHDAWAIWVKKKK